jgi:predicted transcriptional regulator
LRDDQKMPKKAAAPSASTSELVKTAVLRAVCRPYSPIGKNGFISFRADALAQELGLDRTKVLHELEALVQDDVLMPGEEGHYVAMPNMAFAQAMLEKQAEPLKQRVIAVDEMNKVLVEKLTLLESQLRTQPPRNGAVQKKRAKASRRVH